MKKVVIAILLFIVCENTSQAQTQQQILNTIDAQVKNSPTSPLTGDALNSILKSMVNYSASTATSVDVSGLKNNADTFNLVSGYVTRAKHFRDSANLKFLIDANASDIAAKSTTAGVAPSTNRNYVTDPQYVVISNTAGTNSGDETTSSIQTKLGAASASSAGYLTLADWTTFNAKQNALTYTAENIAKRGVANGYAPTDNSNKIPQSYLPAGVLSYGGLWDASTNTPNLSDVSGAVGRVYNVSVAGTQNLGSGSVTYIVGDQIIHNGTIYQKSPNSYPVSSVAGKSGAVTLDAGDIAETSTRLFASPTEKTTWNGKQNALGFTPVPNTVTVNGQPLTGNITVTDITGNAGTVTTNANLSGDVTSAGNVATIKSVNTNIGSFTNANITVNAKGQVIAAASGTAGSSSTGSVQSVSVVSANGITGTVANASTTPAITLSIGSNAITNTNLATGIDATKLTGILSGAQLPAFTGDVSKAAGSTVVSLASGIDPAKLSTGIVNATEFNFLDGVTSAIQPQINGIVGKGLNFKQAKVGYKLMSIVNDTTVKVRTLVVGKNITIDSTTTDSTAIISATDSYSLQASTPAFNPTVNANYYPGPITGYCTSSPGSNKLYIPKGGIITKVYCFWSTSTGTVGSATETASLAFGVNGGPSNNYIATTNIGATANGTISNTAMNVAVNDADYIDLRLGMPATWATLPTQLRLSFIVYIQP